MEIKEESFTSIPDKIMAVMMQLYDFVLYQIEHSGPSSKKKVIWVKANEIINLFYNKLEEINHFIKEADIKTALKRMKSDEPAFWMMKAYKVITLMENQDIKNLFECEQLKSLRESILNLWEFMTQNCYSNCLIKNDKDLEVKEGGVIYIDKSGIITGYSKYVYDNKKIISDDLTALYIFKNICNLHKSLEINLIECLHAKKAIEYSYVVSNPYEFISESKAIIEECKRNEEYANNPEDDLDISKQIYVNKWRKFKDLKVTLKFDSVYFTFLSQTQINQINLSLLNLIL